MDWARRGRGWYDRIIWLSSDFFVSLTEYFSLYTLYTRSGCFHKQDPFTFNQRAQDSSPYHPFTPVTASKQNSDTHSVIRRLLKRCAKSIKIASGLAFPIFLNFTFLTERDYAHAAYSARR